MRFEKVNPITADSSVLATEARRIYRAIELAKGGTGPYRLVTRPVYFPKGHTLAPTRNTRNSYRIRHQAAAVARFLGRQSRLAKDFKKGKTNTYLWPIISRAGVPCWRVMICAVGRKKSCSKRLFFDFEEAIAFLEGKTS